MERVPPPRRAVDLCAVTVRPTFGAQEHRLWDQLVAAHHCLRFGGLFGKGLRMWRLWVRLGWRWWAGRRRRWIGWTLEQQLRRLHLVVQNTRLVILPAFQRVPNLASRVLGLSLRRLAGDMRDEHGYGVLIAESRILGNAPVTQATMAATRGTQEPCSHVSVADLSNRP